MSINRDILPSHIRKNNFNNFYLLIKPFSIKADISEIAMGYKQN